jgi:hypothetical protein
MYPHFKAITLICLLLLCHVVSTAQENFYNNVTISSPTAAALGKYGDVPVNYNTGIPDITIPIYTIKEGPLELPVSLSYHASGLKVAETSSWTGAGWTLNAGGVITRSVRGLPDERGAVPAQLRGHFSDYGYNSYRETFTTGSSTTSSGINNIFNSKWFVDGHLDSEPDLFFFNFNGHSGKFFFRDDRTPVILPEQDLKIEYNYSTDPNFPTSGAGTYSIRGFTITTNEGVKYFFGKTSDAINPNDPVEVTRNGTTSGGMTQPPGVISSWYLYKVMSPDNQFSINISYTSEKYGYPQLSLRDQLASNYQPGQEYTLTKTYVQGVRLSNIIFSNGRVDFTPGDLRQDLSSYDMANPVGDAINIEAVTLGKISLKDNLSHEIKRFDFNYNYFFDGSALTGALLTTYGTAVTTDQKRLKLLNVQETGGDGIKKPPYTFNYFSEAVPRRLSFGQDHWGFINGKINDRMVSTYSIGGTTTVGADREAYFPAMRGGTLNQITYPTGGSVSFNFEPNTFWVTSGQGSNATVGGLRIKTISKNPGNGQNIITGYDYSSYDNIQSSGILYSKPSIVQILRNDLVTKLQVDGFDPNGCFLLPFSPSKGVVFSPTSVRPMATTQGYHIGYSRVRVTQIGNGHSEYRYYGDLPQNVDHSDVAFRSVGNVSFCDPSSPNSPGAPLPFDFVRGELQYVGHFNQTGIEIRKTDYFKPDTLMDKVFTPGMLVTTPLTNTTAAGSAITLYALTSTRKVHQQIVETVHDLNGLNDVVTTTDMYFKSLHHHQLTKKVVNNSKGETLTTNYKYPSDFRIIACDAIDTGFSTYKTRCQQNYSDYNYHIAQCSSNADGSNCRVSAFNEYLYQLGLTRKAFLNTLITNFGNSTPAIPATCYTFNLAPGSFSTTYQYVDQTGATKLLYVDKTSPQNVCAQDGSVNGGPFTKGAVCYTPPAPPPSTNYNHVFDQARSSAGYLLKPIMDLQLLNIIEPIEITSLRNTKVTGSSFNIYDNVAYPSLGYYPNTVQHLKVLASLTDFTNAATSSSSTSVTKDSRYEDRILLKHKFGNLVELSIKGGVTTSYIWDYKNNFPTAKINNSLSSQAAFTSFEGDGTTAPASGNWMLPSNSFDNTKSFSGKQSYNLANGNIVAGISLSAASNYIVSYWTTNSTSLIISGTTGTKGASLSGWTYFEHKITGQTGIIIPTGVANIDELRLYPVGALMTTYTYDPLVGITSMVDAKGLITYYEYDNFQRLMNIRDKDGNIIKHTDYHYQGQ